MTHPADPTSFDLLDDDALWDIVHSQLSAGDVTRLTWLLEENADNALTASERAELEARSTAASRFVERKASAAAVLQRRGHDVPSDDGL